MWNGVIAPGHELTASDLVSRLPGPLPGNSRAPNLFFCSQKPQGAAGRPFRSRKGTHSESRAPLLRRGDEDAQPMPVVSTIFPSFDRRETILRCLERIHAQTFEDRELRVVADEFPPDHLDRLVGSLLAHPDCAFVSCEFWECFGADRIGEHPRIERERERIGAWGDSIIDEAGPRRSPGDGRAPSDGGSQDAARVRGAVSRRGSGLVREKPCVTPSARVFDPCSATVRRERARPRSVDAVRHIRVTGSPARSGRNRRIG